MGIYHPKQQSKNSLATLAPFFAEWRCKLATGPHENSFLRLAMQLCGPGLQHLVSSQPAKRFPTALSSDSGWNKGNLASGRREVSGAVRVQRLRRRHSVARFPAQRDLARLR